MVDDWLKNFAGQSLAGDLSGDSQWVLESKPPQTKTPLVGGLEHFFHILGIITPTDFHIFQKGLKPPEMDDLSRGIPDFGGEHP